MLQSILQNKKTSGLVLLGLAAFAYYRYSKMSTEEKNKLVDTITKTGKDWFGQVFKAGSDNGASAADTAVAGAAS